MVKTALELGNRYGYGVGYGSGYGYGVGYGAGAGVGYGYGVGYGAGAGVGYGDGVGYGAGAGAGYGDVEMFRQFMDEIKDLLNSQDILKVANQELKRIMIEVMGADRFFRDLECQIVHRDVDMQGQERLLLRIPIAETEVGYLQAVKVVCPTTGRVYYLGAPPDVSTCQEAVASTFKLKAHEYKPRRES